MPPSRSARAPITRRWWPLVGVALLAAALRWYRIDAQSLWYDEGISAFQLHRSYLEILSAAALDTHPPLYYWTLKAWATGLGLGSSELGLRSLSAAFGLAAVGLTFVLGRRLFGGLPAALAAILLAAAPLAVYYSQEVRMYAQVTALALLATYAYVQRKDWLYAVAALLTLYTQYLGVAILVALNIHALLWMRARTPRQWLGWAAANALVAVGFAPWLPTLIAQQTHSLNTSPRTPDRLTLETLTAYGGGIVRSEVFVAAGAVLVALALLGLVLGVVVARERKATSLSLLIWLAPLALVLGLGLRNGLFEIRYLVLSLPGLCLLAGLAIARLVRHPAAAVAVACIALVPAGLALAQQYFDPSLARDDYRGVIAAIEGDAQPNDAIVLSAPNQVEVFSYYYHGPLATVALPAQRPMDAVDTRARLDSIKAQHARVWLVSWAMPEADPLGVINTWLAENAFPARHAWYGTVQLVLLGFAPTSDNSTTERVRARLDNGITLVEYRLSSRSVKPGETLALTLLWRADLGPTAGRSKVFTHLLDARSMVVAQHDAEPSDNLRPTTSWQRGERIEDNHGIAIPPNLPAGSYTLEIGMYDGERRSVFTGFGDHLILGEVQIQP